MLTGGVLPDGRRVRFRCPPVLKKKRKTEPWVKNIPCFQWCAVHVQRVRDFDAMFPAACLSSATAQLVGEAGGKGVCFGTDVLLSVGPLYGSESVAKQNHVSTKRRQSSDSGTKE